MNNIADSFYRIQRKILYKELEPLFIALSSINYAVVKGEVLSQQIYGSTDKRRPSDIDILVDKNDVKKIENELFKLGFNQKDLDDNKKRHIRVLCMTYSHQIPSFYKEKLGFGLSVDINFDIFWGEYEGKRCSIKEFLSDTVETNIYNVAVKSLPVEKAFVQLILHHYKEMNSLYHLTHYNCIRTNMFKDIYIMLLFNMKAITVKRVIELCETYSIGSIVYYMVYYTYLVFNDTFLLRYLEKLECYKDVTLIKSYGLSSRERKNWKVSFNERLDNDQLCSVVIDELSASDLIKMEINHAIFD